MSFDLYQSLADLRSQWNILQDLDRATQVCLLLNFGISRRTLARALGVSEGLIRRLTVVNEALAEEKLLTRRGKLSTNKLVRRVRNRQLHQAARRAERHEEERNVVAHQMADQIIQWLKQHLGRGYVEQVVVEAHQRLAEAELAGNLPRGAAPLGTPLAEIIDRCRPTCDPDELPTSTYSLWLTLWTYYAIPDSDMRDLALSLAWERVIREG